jgi:hypothetical protein
VPDRKKKRIAHLSDFVGANASAEEQEESLEDGAKTVNNIAHSFRLQATAYDKKAYLAHLKVIISLPHLRTSKLITMFISGLHEGCIGTFASEGRGCCRIQGQGK